MQVSFLLFAFYQVPYENEKVNLKIPKRCLKSNLYNIGGALERGSPERNKCYESWVEYNLCTHVLDATSIKLHNNSSVLFLICNHGQIYSAPPVDALRNSTSPC